MRFVNPDIDDLARKWATEPENAKASAREEAPPQIMDVATLLALPVSPPAMLVENILPCAGATLLFGAPKSNKTLVAVQTGIAIAANHPLFDYYRVISSGPVLMVEQDDPAGAASLKEILKRSPVPVEGIPFYLAPRVPFTFGPQLIEWLEAAITERKVLLVVLDSYTALRGSRSLGVDIVKAEQTDLIMIDELAKRTGCHFDCPPRFQRIGSIKLERQSGGDVRNERSDGGPNSHLPFSGSGQQCRGASHAHSWAPSGGDGTRTAI